MYSSRPGSVITAIGLIACGGAEEPTESGEPGSGGDAGSEDVGQELLGGVAWRTNRVLLTAARFSIEANGNTYFGRGWDLEVGGDPGDESYDTLEIVWNERGFPMYLFLYFVSDGIEWWSEEQLTAAGTTTGEDIRYFGEQFRSPIGQPFVGDVVIDSPPDAPIPGKVTIEGMKLQAFLAPACDGSPVYLEPIFPVVEMTYYPGTTLEYHTGFWVRDETCVEIPSDDLDFTWTVDDPDIARVEPNPDPEAEPRHAIIYPLAVGETTVRVESRRDGTLVAEQSVPVLIESP